MMKSTALALSFLSTQVWAADASLETLKSKIVSIAQTYTGDDSKLVEAREALNPLVAEIAAFNQNKTAGEQLPLLVGGWKEIWSDEREPTPPNFTIDRTQVYQVIDPNGFFYNLSDTKTPMGTVTGILRGVYAAGEGVALNIEFTGTKVRFEPLKAGANLVDLIDGIENEPVPSAAKPSVPGGPVGIKGILENVYVDSELRVAIEKDLQQNVRALFILERSDVVVK